MLQKEEEHRGTLIDSCRQINLQFFLILGLVLCSPLTRMRYLLPFSLISLTKGHSRLSTWDGKICGGGTTMQTLSLKGEFKILVHFLTSGNCSFSILIVLIVAVAVIIRMLLPRLLTSPVLKAMTGRKACSCPLFTPQLATKIYSLK